MKSSNRNINLGRTFLIHFFVSLCLLSTTAITSSAEEAREKNIVTPITDKVWREAVVSVTDLKRSARFFQEIGGYVVKWQGEVEDGALRFWGVPQGATAEAMLLGPETAETGLVRLIRFDNAGRKVPTRPGARAWDTGCYFSLMVRMKDLSSIYDDSIALGWWTETPIAYLEFGASKLNVVIFRGPDGVQVQGYERLAPPLPAAIPPFQRMTSPFNVMQMVRDRDVSYDFFTSVLGFATFYKGEPYTSPAPAYMPLGIPYNLTTTVAYQAGIVYPLPGEFGRMEMIEIMGLDGRDYAQRCHAPNLGILAVRFPVENVRQAINIIKNRGGAIASPLRRLVLAPYGNIRMFAVKTPDGANIQFYQIEKNIEP